MATAATAARRPPPSSTMHTMHTMHDAHTMDHAPRHNHTVPHCHRDSCHAAVFIMGKDLRAIFSRRHSYATKSNKTLKVKTPGGSLVLHQLKKLSKGPRCGETGVTLHGVSELLLPPLPPLPPSPVRCRRRHHVVNCHRTMSILTVAITTATTTLLRPWRCL